MKIEVQGGGLTIPINPNIDFYIEKLKVLAQRHKIKLYLASKNSGSD